MRTRRSVLPIVLLLAFVAGACGSTAKTSSKTSGDDGSAVTASQARGSAGGPAGSAPGSSGRTARSDAAIGGISRPGTVGGSGSVGGSVPGSTFIPANGPGITNSTIYVAIAYSSQSGQADKAIGAAGAAPSYDYRNVFNAAANYANAHGGFGGRKVKALFYDYNVTDDQNGQDQSACAHWTQDNKVFLMGGGNDILDTCAEKAHAVAIGGGATADTFKKYPHLIDPIGIRLDRLGQVTVSGLYKAGYFTGKLGLVTWDDPNYRAAMTKGYFPELAKYHIKPVDTRYIMVPQEFQALGDMTAAVSSAVAKFKAEGIDHVIVQDGAAGVWGGTGLTFEWMNQSKSQQYYPRYGQNTGNSPGWEVLPSDQMDHALAIDEADYDKKFDEGWHVNADRENCFKIEKDAGYPVNSSNLNDEVAAGASCDIVFFMQRFINSLPMINADNFVAAAGRSGTAFHSALVYGVKLLPERRDGGDMVRTEEYLDSCKCLKFRGPPQYAD